MALRVLAEIKCLCYPRSAIPGRRGTPFVVSDVLGQRMNFAQGDNFGLALQGFNPTITDSWMQNQMSDAATFKSISSNLEWVRFGSDGRFYEGASASANAGVDEPQGFILQGREAPLDCIIPAPEGAPAAPDTSFFNQTWRAVKGKWRSVLPPGVPSRVWLINSGSETEAIAETVGMVPGDRSCRVDFNFSGLGNASSAACRFAWGAQVTQETASSLTTAPQWSISFRHGQKPTLERNIDGRWVILRRLNTSFLCNLTGGRYTLYIRRINGYLVITIGGESFHFLQTSKGVQSGTGSSVNSTQPDKNNAAQESGIPWTWDEGHWQVTANNTRVRFGTMLIKYANVGDTPMSGNFVRFIPRKEPVWGTLRAWASGWIPPNAASITTEVTPNPGIGLDYTCTLTGSEQGLDTPFVNKVMIYAEPVWTQSPPSPLDVTAAVGSWSVSKAMPPLANGNELQLEIDRTILNRVSAAWEDYVDSYNPIEFSVRWQYDDGSVGDWVRLFKGYIWKGTKTTRAINDRMLALICRDPIMRLQAPAALIDHRYPPMDFKWLESGKSTFYGSDVVQSILQITLGPDESAKLNGDGNGQRFFSSGHYPLLSMNRDICGYFQLPSALGGAQPPSTMNSYYLPAPYGEDALGWIGKICKYDYASFLYGWPPGVSENDEWPSPIYGRLALIIGSRPVKYVVDAKYSPADLEKLLMMQARVETRPEGDINRVLVWANNGGGEIPNYLPATRMAEARLPTSDRNSAERSWERTMVLREDIGFVPTSAEGIAYAVINETKNQYRVYPTLTCTGDATVQWGDIIEIRQNANDCTIGLSDTTMRLDGRRFRVESVTHSGHGELAGFNSFMTEMSVRPFTTSGF